MNIITPKKQFLNKNRQFSCCTNDISNHNHQQNQYLPSQQFIIAFDPTKQQQRKIIYPQLSSVNQSQKTPMVDRNKRDFQTEESYKWAFNSAAAQQTCHRYSKISITYIDDLKEGRKINPQNDQRLHRAERQKPIILFKYRNNSMAKELHETIANYRRIYYLLRQEESEMVKQKIQNLQAYQNTLQDIEQTRSFLNANSKIREGEIAELKKVIAELNTYFKAYDELN